MNPQSKYESVIQSYVSRFRNERPTAPSLRSHSRSSKEFWWLREEADTNSTARDSLEASDKASQVLQSTESLPFFDAPTDAASFLGESVSSIGVSEDFVGAEDPLRGSDEYFNSLLSRVEGMLQSYEAKEDDDDPANFRRSDRVKSKPIDGSSRRNVIEDKRSNRQERKVDSKAISNSMDCIYSDTESESDADSSVTSSDSLEAATEQVTPNIELTSKQTETDGITISERIDSSVLSRLPSEEPQNGFVALSILSPPLPVKCPSPVTPGPTEPPTETRIERGATVADSVQSSASLPPFSFLSSSSDSESPLAVTAEQETAVTVPPTPLVVDLQFVQGFLEDAMVRKLWSRLQIVRQEIDVLRKKRDAQLNS